VQLRKKGGSYSGTARLAVDGSQSSWTIWTDWNEPALLPLTPGTTYYWRVGFDPGAAGGGDAVFGAEQTFTSLWSSSCSGRPITVSIGLGQQPTAGNDVILGTPGPDRIFAGGGNDIVCAGAGNDVVDGGAGNDRVDAGAGNDTVIARAGNDVVIGGAGSDTVSYAGNPVAVRVNLAGSGAQNTAGAGIDAIVGTENLFGGNGNDILTGNAAGNRISAGPGNDRVDGAAGNDRIDAGSGNDTVVARVGNDTVIGGPGIDVVSYAGNPAAVRVNLGTAARQNTRGAGLDILTGTENLVGGNGSDILTANAAGNRITAGPGNDRIDGGPGNDRVDGGQGNDTVIARVGNDTSIGGPGIDVISYAGNPAAVRVSLATAARQNTRGAGLDIVTGFENLNGGNRNDWLTGNGGANLLKGGPGLDRCNGGAGRDRAIGCEIRTSVP
jgi:Ca2+-binding RTX toxin-like protein